MLKSVKVCYKLGSVTNALQCCVTEEPIDINGLQRFFAFVTNRPLYWKFKKI